MESEMEEGSEFITVFDEDCIFQTRRKFQRGILTIVIIFFLGNYVKRYIRKSYFFCFER